MSDQRSDAEPRICGRFNFISYRKNLYNVLYTGYGSQFYVKIAENLSFDEMQELKNKLNAVLEEAKTEFYEDVDQEQGEAE
jgi:hypothetical protein